MIDPKVYRALYPYAIRKFIESKKIDCVVESTKYNINIVNKKEGYYKLLDALLDDRRISNAHVDEFLINELNYGRLRNLYVSFIEDIAELETEENVVNFVRCLDYENAELINNGEFIQDLRSGLGNEEKKLIHFKIEKKKDNSVKNINILLAEGITKQDGLDCNNYYSIEFNLEYKLLVIRIRNLNTEVTSYCVDTMYKTIQKDLCTIFPINLTPMTKISQKIVYNMINTLSGKVLDPIMNKVDNKIKTSVENQTSLWSEQILSQENILLPAEKDVLQQLILNNYYKIYMQNEVGTIKIQELKHTFKVNGYPRFVRFEDDTIGEGYARSADPSESLLDTSIFYDIKARLDQAKQIKQATIYWIDSSGYEKFGTTFYTDVQNRFKCIILANFFDKEMCDYVLQQINEYHQRS